MNLDQWSAQHDPLQLYVLCSNILLWNIAIAVSFISYLLCYKHIRDVKRAVEQLNACPWTESREIVQLRRLFFLTSGLTFSWIIMAYQVWYSAITQQPVAPEIDQAAILVVSMFMLVHPFALLRINIPMRHAVLDLLRWRRSASVLPTYNSMRGSKPVSGVRESVNDPVFVNEGNDPLLSSRRVKTMGPPRKSHSPSQAITAGFEKLHSLHASLSRSAHHAPRALATDRHTLSTVKSALFTSPVVHTVSLLAQPSSVQSQRFTASSILHKRHQSDSQDELYHSVLFTSSMPPLHPPPSAIKPRTNSEPTVVRSHQPLTASAPLMILSSQLEGEVDGLFVDAATAADQKLTIHPLARDSSASQGGFPTDTDQPPDRRRHSTDM